MSNNKTKFSAGMIIMGVFCFLGITLVILDKIMTGSVSDSARLMFLISLAALCIMGHINSTHHD
jgi:hypothetical protein